MDIVSIILLAFTVLFLMGLIVCLLKLRSIQSQLSTAEDQNRTLNAEVAKLQSSNQGLLAEREAITNKYKSVIDAELEKSKILGELELNKSRLLSDALQIENSHRQNLEVILKNEAQAASQLNILQENIIKIRQEVSLLDEISTMQSFGFYAPRYGFESSRRYQLEIDRIRGQQKAMIAGKTAAVSLTEWTVNGSVVEGRKQINQTLKLILRAFNGECDAAIAKVRYNNVSVMENRILKAYEALNKLVSVQQAHINNLFLNLKLQELYLVHEYQEKTQEEKEEQRRIKEEMREEEIARREIEKALADADREENRFSEALKKAREEAQKAVGEQQNKLLAQIEMLEAKLAEVEFNKQRAMSRAQMTRSGHVYIISNVGSFGENIYKIGMTRRLDPMDRVVELGDASVPFRFDVHAIIYCEDAPKLENQLHKKFHHRRINQVNHRKEFFKVTLNEIAAAVKEFHGEIEFTLLAEAMEYRKTLAFLQASESNRDSTRAAFVN